MWLELDGLEVRADEWSERVRDGDRERERLRGGPQQRAGESRGHAGLVSCYLADLAGPTAVSHMRLVWEVWGFAVELRVPVSGRARPQRRSFVITAAVIRLQRLQQQHAAVEARAGNRRFGGTEGGLWPLSASMWCQPRVPFRSVASMTPRRCLCSSSYDRTAAATSSPASWRRLAMTGTVCWSYPGHGAAGSSPCSPAAAAVSSCRAARRSPARSWRSCITAKSPARPKFSAPL